MKKLLFFSIIYFAYCLTSNIIFAAPRDSIPLKTECKNSNSLGEDYVSCNYKIQGELNFNLMISKKSGRHTLTIFHQKDYDDSKTKYYLKSGNLLHSCLIILPTNPLTNNFAFVSVKDGTIVSDWQNPKCSL